MTHAPAAKASWIPLMTIQGHRRPIGYAMTVQQHASGLDARAHSEAARARLRNLVAPAAVEAINAVRTVRLVAAEPEQVAPDTVPLNMLTTCSWRFLVDLAAVRHQQSAKDILGPSRVRPLCAARNEAVYLVVLHTVFSIARIGRMFGKDHTSILAILQKFPKVIRPRLRSAIAQAPAVPRAAYADKPERLRIVAEGYAAGLSTEQIAEQICMSISTVKQIALRNSLRHPSRPYYRSKYGFVSEAAAQ